jgi:hypothetical protein
MKRSAKSGIVIVVECSSFQIRREFLLVLRRARRLRSGVEARPSRLSETRNVVDVVFAFTHRETDVSEKYFVRVDVTEEFPFLVTKLSPYNDR